MERTRIGIVGLGTIAQTIHLPILSKVQDAEILAVCDLDRGKAEFVAKKYNIRRAYSDYEEMLARETDIVGVDVCTSTFTHREVALAALEAGKDLLVEKPLARTQKEAIDIAQAAKKAGRKVMIKR